MMQEMETLYQEIILEHFRRPHGKGLAEENPTTSTGLSHQFNPTCGDELTIQVQLNEQQEIATLTYEGQGCSISQASASVMSDLLTGRSLSEALEIFEYFNELMHSKGQITPDEEVLGDAIAFAGVSKYPMRIKCALLGWMGFKEAAIKASFESKESQDVSNDQL